MTMTWILSDWKRFWILSRLVVLSMRSQAIPELLQAIYTASHTGTIPESVDTRLYILFPTTLYPGFSLKPFGVALDWHRMLEL